MSVRRVAGGQASNAEGSREPVAGERSGGWRGALRRLLAVLLFGAIAAAVLISLRDQDWSVLATATGDREPVYFVLTIAAAFASSAAAMLLAMVTWRAVMSGLDDRVSAVRTARIFFVVQFAKFVPGKVLSYVVSIQMGKAIGVAPGRMISAWLLTLVVVLLTGATVGLAAGPEVFGGTAAWLALAAVPIVAALVRPELVNRVAVGAARLLRRPPPATRVSSRRVRRALVAQLLAWVLLGVQLWLIAMAMGAPPARSFLLCVGAFSLATVIGTFIVLAPEGLGLREAVLVVALSVIMPLPVAGVVVLVSRLVVTLSELSTAGVGLLATELLRRRRRRALEVPAGPGPPAVASMDG